MLATVATTPLLGLPTRFPGSAAKTMRNWVGSHHTGHRDINSSDLENGVTNRGGIVWGIEPLHKSTSVVPDGQLVISNTERYSLGGNNARDLRTLLQRTEDVSPSPADAAQRITVTIG